MEDPTTASEPAAKLGVRAPAQDSASVCQIRVFGRRCRRLVDVAHLGASSLLHVEQLNESAQQPATIELFQALTDADHRTCVSAPRFPNAERLLLFSVGIGRIDMDALAFVNLSWSGCRNHYSSSDSAVWRVRRGTSVDLSTSGFELPLLELGSTYAVFDAHDTSGSRFAVYPDPAVEAIVGRRYRFCLCQVSVIARLCDAHFPAVELLPSILGGRAPFSNVVASSSSNELAAIDGALSSTRQGCWELGRHVNPIASIALADLPPPLSGHFVYGGRLQAAVIDIDDGGRVLSVDAPAVAIDGVLCQFDAAAFSFMRQQWLESGGNASTVPLVAVAFRCGDDDDEMLPMRATLDIRWPESDGVRERTMLVCEVTVGGRYRGMDEFLLASPDVVRSVPQFPP